MTLNKKNTALLNTALADELNFFYWLKNETTVISNAHYEEIEAMFESWNDGYDAQNLYGTNPDNTTFLYAGIGQFPRPPKR